MAEPSTSSSPSRLYPEAHSPVKIHPLLVQEQQQQQQRKQQQLPLFEQPQQLALKAPTSPPHLPSHAAQHDPSDTNTVQNNHAHFVTLSPGHDPDSSCEGDPTNIAPTSTNGGSTAYTRVKDQPTSATTSSSDPPVNGHIEDGQDGTRYNSDRPLPTSPPMSNNQPPPGPPRQPVSYPISTSYPTSGMPSGAQYAYPPQAVPPTDPYRPNPTALPSMRTLDHVQSHQQLPQHHPHHPHPHQHQHQHQHPIPLASHMGASMTPSHAMGYYNVAAHPYSMHPDPTGGMRFAIAPGLPPDPRIALSGGRHKKVPVHQDNSRYLSGDRLMLTDNFCLPLYQEIKRRTKTGCLTCRKRRIKVRCRFLALFSCAHLPSGVLGELGWRRWRAEEAVVSRELGERRAKKKKKQEKKTSRKPRKC